MGVVAQIDGGSSTEAEGPFDDQHGRCTDEPRKRGCGKDGGEDAGDAGDGMITHSKGCRLHGGVAGDAPESMDT